MRDAGLAVELLETRHVHDAFKAMPVKTDRNMGVRLKTTIKQVELCFWMLRPCRMQHGSEVRSEALASR